MYEVLCLGLTSCDLIFAELDRFPILGKEVACKDFIIKAGGAANTPMALTKLGVNVVFCTTLGNDISGRIVYQYMKEIGMDMQAVIVDNEYRTNVSAVLSVGKERGFATYFAPYESEEMIRQLEKHIQQCSHIHAYIEDCLRIPIIEIAQKYNKTISVDTAWDEKIKLEDIKHIIKGCDIFFTNEIEACSITETHTAMEAIDIIGEYAKVVVVKMGADGSIIRHDSKTIVAPVISKVEAIDTTGAGDLYGAGFIYGFIKGWDMEKCAKFATASGNLAVTFYGGMDEKYTLQNVEKLYNCL